MSGYVSMSMIYCRCTCNVICTCSVTSSRFISTEMALQRDEHCARTASLSSTVQLMDRQCGPCEKRRPPWRSLCLCRVVYRTLICSKCAYTYRDTGHVVRGAETRNSASSDCRDSG